ncbi:hypothetical protein MLD38_026671 [Melastoma candidum]|uniref:Uncharacterized protein n=1 Tax=Melastoma candidum TaxID=119954 RepID=A0ACB9P0C8_9MYRT|nr:hypothetical protein MLD38_026671 [Melastoma candidum]
MPSSSFDCSWTRSAAAALALACSSFLTLLSSAATRFVRHQVLCDVRRCHLRYDKCRVEILRLLLNRVATIFEENFAKI